MTEGLCGLVLIVSEGFLVVRIFGDGEEIGSHCRKRLFTHFDEFALLSFGSSCRISMPSLSKIVMYLNSGVGGACAAAQTELKQIYRTNLFRLCSLASYKAEYASLLSRSRSPNSRIFFTR